MELGGSPTSRPAFGARQIPSAWIDGEQISIAHMRGCVRRSFWEMCKFDDRAKGFVSSHGIYNREKSFKVIAFDVTQ